MRTRLVAVTLFLLAFAAPVRADVIRVVIDGVIHPITAEIVQRAVDQATRENARAVLIELRTPGGLETSTREIVQKIVGSHVPIIVWVGPSGSRAASAGFFILQAADVAAMAPGTNTGAAHPVSLGGEPDEVMKKKIENDTAALMRSIVGKRGRNVAVAESAVRDSKSFTDSEALAQHLIDVIAPNDVALLKHISSVPVRRFDGSSVRIDLSKERIREFPTTLRQRVLGTLMDPNIAFLLFALGAMALWAEFSHPGAIVPGVVGALSIVLAIFALNLLPTRFAAFALILLALALFALEAKFVSHGILGAGGVAAMTIGAMLLVDGPIPEMRVGLITALAVSIPFGIITVFLMTLALRAQRMRHVTGEESMIGLVGVVRTPLAPQGQIFIRGELWRAVASEPVDVGAQVVVQQIDGLTLHVTPSAQLSS
jgi:membrane-bound serine protease (ClpP class)